ncbi:MAG: DUF1491 family protein [Alphaproteobacteria bacterium]|nr:DUF1491 family protein [Alphaproteobacteria bacterium]MBU6472025.1 DUF1491 family protein [Alphaproteobacteria bacterium]MDE2013597.1 DUF1491 family protein [Alphaproteobacteria bacterium]MDE2074238.1 DUF1491 family protein [Alphaproteobacteria bacterium]MDE2352977.1 DUF1491 family protein [Alphaproteobacteria bacterium]
MTPRLKAGIFVRALIRRAEVAGAAAYVAKKGAEEAGAVLIKIARLDGTCTVLSQARRGEGELIWLKPLGDNADEAAASAYFERQRKYDPDLWIVEIEDRQGRTFVDEPVV